MKLRITPILLVSAIFLTSCGSQQDKDRERIENLSDSLSLISEQNEYRMMAGELLQLCLQYALAYPEDTMSPRFLINAKDYALNVNDPIQSVRIIDDFLNRYPEHGSVPDMLFTQAFIYENYLGDLERAKVTYESFLEAYPDYGKLSFDARFALDHLGMSPEDVLAEILAGSSDSTGIAQGTTD